MTFSHLMAQRTLSSVACETFRKRRRTVFVCALLMVFASFGGVAGAQEHKPTPPAAPGHDAPPPPATDTAKAPVERTTPPAGAAAPHAPDSPAPAATAGHAGGDAHAAEEAHDESPWGLVARIVNFAILVGGLGYLLRGPLGLHLQGRRQRISGDLESARATTAKAESQLAEIDRRLSHLPAELESLRERGAEGIANEEAAIRQRAEAERQRLLEQTRREVELEVRVARRALVEHTADLAVSLAAERVAGDIASDDRRRLLDRYVSRVKELHG